MTNRAAVSFQVQQSPSGELTIALLLTREGETAPAQDKVFAFDLLPDLELWEANTLAEALSRCVTHLRMAEAHASVTASAHAAGSFSAAADSEAPI